MVVVYYLIFIAIILEILHIVIPERSFQFTDLFGNLLGVLIVVLINFIIKKMKFLKNKIVLSFFLYLQHVLQFLETPQIVVLYLTKGIFGISILKK